MHSQHGRGSRSSLSWAPFQDAHPAFHDQFGRRLPAHLWLVHDVHVPRGAASATALVLAGVRRLLFAWRRFLRRATATAACHGEVGRSSDVHAPSLSRGCAHLVWPDASSGVRPWTNCLLAHPRQREVLRKPYRPQQYRTGKNRGHLLATASRAPLLAPPKGHAMQVFSDNLGRLMGLHDVKASELFGLCEAAFSTWFTGTTGTKTSRTAMKISSFFEIPPHRLATADFRVAQRSRRSVVRARPAQDPPQRRATEGDLMGMVSVGKSVNAAFGSTMRSRAVSSVGRAGDF